MSIELEQYKEYKPDRSGPPGWVKALLIGALIVSLFGGAYLGVRWLAETVNDALGGDPEPIVEAGLPVDLDIPLGSTAAQIAQQLADTGVVLSASEFESAVRSQRVTDQLKAGFYQLTTGMTVDEAIAVLVEGPLGSGAYRVTIIEGLTVEQMLTQLADQTGYTLGQLRDPLLDGTVTSSLLRGVPQTTTDWEGLLWPDTYEFREDAAPVDVLQVLADTAVARVESVDWTRLEEMGFTPYDGVVIASLIEREARLDSERPLIAGVIFNRLEQGIPLQIDATIIYAKGGGTSVSLDDLEIDSPYNTYRLLGLTPTPIAGPRMASLQAAAAPADTTFLYYVLADPEEGRHVFTDDFDEFLDFQERIANGEVIP